MTKSPPPPDLDALIRWAPGPVAVLDREMTILAANDALLDALGATRESAVGRQILSLFPTDDPAAAAVVAEFRASLDRVLATHAADRMSVTRYDVPRPASEGGGFEERYWSPLNYPVLDAEGRLTHIVHKSDDVTELTRLRRRDAERAAALSEANAELRAIYDQGLFAARLDLDGRVIDVNRSALEQCGYTREEVVGRPFWECGWWNRSPKVQAWVKDAVDRAIGGETFRGVSPYFVADGSERVTEFACMPIKDEAGNVRLVLPTGIDITGRSEVERDHRATAILESITDAFFSLDRDWRFTYLNPQAERQLQRSQAELLGKVVWEEFPAAIGTNFEREYRAAMAERRAATFEEYYPAPLDNWFEVNGYPSDEGLSVYFRNITERKRAEERERAAATEARLQGELVRTITENTSAALFMMDARGHCTYMNHAAVEMTGYRLEEIAGRALHRAIHHARPDGAPYPIEECPIDRALPERNQVRNHEDLFIRKDGTFFPVAVSAEPIIQDGTPVGTVVEVRDITQSKRAVEELRASEERFRLTADHAPVFIWIAGLDKRCTWFNKPWLEFTGRTMEQEYGYGWAEGVHPDDLDRCLRIYTANFDARRPFLMEYRLRDRDGRYHWLVDNGIPLYGAGGEFTGFIGSCVDITERIEAEQELRENDRRKDEFLAMLAHELRNPIAAIGNAAQVGLLSASGEGREWSHEVIDRQVKHLSRLIDDLLDVSRITRGKIELRRQLVELSPILEAAIESVMPLIEERQHQLHVSPLPRRLYLEADATRVEQIVVNLLTNAAKYTERGGEIWLASSFDGDQISITVRDTGVGIPPESLPRMFELFAQGDRSLARSEGGLGIGLTLVKSLAEMHGGGISAFSEGAGKGSEFTVTLPAAQASARPVRKPEPPADPPGPRGRRVLIIDDNLDTARGMSRLLKMIGHTVETAHEGNSAFEVAREFLPDVILLDIGLPGMNGYEVARRLRADDRCREALIIAISGYAQDQDRRLSREAGIDHHLAKPVDHEMLRTLMAAGGKGVEG